MNKNSKSVLSAILVFFIITCFGFSNIKTLGINRAYAFDLDEGSNDTMILKTLISNTPEEGTLIIPDGVIYNVNDEIIINKNIKIDGKGTIKASSNFPQNKNLIKITADNVEIKNITVDGNNNNQYTEFTGNGDKLNNILIEKADNIKINTVKCINSKFHGICFLGDCRNIKIENCSISNFIGCGIIGHWAFDDKTKPAYPIIQDNIINDALQVKHNNQTFGILLSAVDNAIVKNNYIKNTYSKTGDGGIMLYSGDIESSCNYNIVESNSIEMELDYIATAIRLEGRNNSKVLGNIITKNNMRIHNSLNLIGIRAFVNSNENSICNNKIDGGRTGIIVDATSNGNCIYRNEIINSELHGIEIRGTGNCIDLNKISNINVSGRSSCGILLNNIGIKCSDNYIKGNDKYKITYGIYSSTKKGMKIYGNKVVNYKKGITNI